MSDRGTITRCWSWRDVYPGARLVTLILDDFEAAELLDQARGEGRLIAPDTIRGMPAVAFGDAVESAPASVEGADERFLCQSCREPLPATKQERLERADVPPAWRAICERLARSTAPYVSYDSLEMLVEEVSRTGELDAPRSQLMVVKSKHRHALKAVGLEVVTVQGLGMTLRLVEAAEIPDERVVPPPPAAIEELPDRAAAKPRRPDRRPTDPTDLEAWQTLGRKLDLEPAKTTFKEASEVPPVPAPKPTPVRVERPLRPAPAPDLRRAPLVPAKPKNEELQAMVDAAIAAGKMTVCPPCKHSVEPGELLPGEGWRRPGKSWSRTA